MTTINLTTQAPCRTWPKALDQRIQQVMALTSVSLYARARVAVGFITQQLEREGLAENPSVLDSVDALIARVFPEPDCCDGCGTYDDGGLKHTVTGALRCRDCLDAIALDGSPS